MTLREQEQAANDTRVFLQRWGLKGKYVAGVCEMPNRTLSKFLNHKVALSDNQMIRLKSYMADYEMRNG